LACPQSRIHGERPIPNDGMGEHAVAFGADRIGRIPNGDSCRVDLFKDEAAQNFIVNTWSFSY